LCSKCFTTGESHNNFPAAALTNNHPINLSPFMAKILIVDDTLRDRTQVSGLLKKQSDWEIALAVDGVDALEKVASDAPDLIVTDLMMPNMDGLELVKTVTKKHPLIPIILMTSQGSEDVAVQALQAGAASYSSKEMLAKTLVETIENVLAVSIQKKTEAAILSHLTETEVVFNLANDADITPALVSYLQGECERHGLITESERVLIGVALDEALVNAIFHGNLELPSSLRDTDRKRYHNLVQERTHSQPFCDRNVVVKALINQEQGVFTITDSGPGFDPTTLPDPTDPANLTKLGGRGILLMRTFMDEVTYNEVGNQVRLVKNKTEAEE